MIKWLIAVVLALVLFAGFENAVRKLGLGRLPGDFRLRIRGRSLFVPLTSTLLLSLLVTLIMALL